MEYIPLFDKILIRRTQKEQKSAGGIILSSGASEEMRPFTGEVLEIGGDVKKVTVGQEVYFSRYAGLEVELDKEKLLILREEELLLVRKNG